jgi:hypothetical protein
MMDWVCNKDAEKTRYIYRILVGIIVGKWSL